MSWAKILTTVNSRYKDIQKYSNFKMHICVIRFSFGIFHQALVTKPDQVDISVKGVIWITFTWTGCPIRDKVNCLPHHKLIIDFFLLLEAKF